MDSIKETTNDNNVNSSPSLFSDKNTLIVILLCLLLLSFLGINLLKNMGDFFQFILNGIAYFLKPLFSDVSFITGTVIDTSSDIVADASKTGIDIAHGTVHSVGDLFIRASGNETDKDGKKVPLSNIRLDEDHIKQKNRNIDDVINESKSQNKLHTPSADSTTNPIQKPISSNKTGWCLIDEYEGQRNCISVTEHDKCMSQQVYPTQKMCLNPTITK